MTYFTIGADIEVFGKNRAGQFIALCGMIGGTKHKPLQLSGLPAGYMVQEDNVSLEYNIPPTDSRSNFIQSIGIMDKMCSDILRKFDLVVGHESSASFTEDQLVHPQALVFGCEPDYNAWNKTENTKPTCDDKSLRTAGGHVHVGTNEVDMIAGVRWMDLMLGVPSVLLDNTPDAKKRRLLYGKSGAMRPKPYGWEYRSLSNFWMFSPQLTAWVFDNTHQALKRAMLDKELTIIEAQRIQNCINTGDEAEALKIVKEYSIPMPISAEEQKRLDEEARIKEKEMLAKYAKIYGEPVFAKIDWNAIGAPDQAFAQVIQPVPTGNIITEDVQQEPDEDH